MSTFNSVKKTSFATINSALGAITKSASSVEVGISIVEDYLLETKATRDLNKVERMAEKAKQSQRDLIVEGQENAKAFYKALAENEATLNELREKLSTESLDKYAHLL